MIHKPRPIALDLALTTTTMVVVNAYLIRSLPCPAARNPIASLNEN